MAAHPDPQLEGVLQALATGDRDERDAEVQALFAGRPGLRERFERMRGLAGEIDRIGAADRALLDEAATRQSPFDAEARRLVMGRLGPVRRFPVRLIAAAALLVAALVAAFLLHGRAADENSTLGLGAGEQEPRGPVRDYERFRWSLPLPAGCVYVLSFHGDGPDGGDLFKAGPLTATQWSPDAEQRRKMTARMTWEVDVLDLNGNFHDGIGPVSVWLQR